MSKVVLVPIFALVLLFVQKIMGFQFSNEELQILNDGMLSLAVLIGILSDPKKKK
jgi:uncharacterized membrane protein